MRVGLWLIAGIAGSVVFWLVQLLAGGPTITEFMGQQIVSAGGYSPGLVTAIGWSVHLGVSLSYALLVGLVVFLARSLRFGTGAGIALVAAVGLGWGTAIIAPPAISVTISFLARQGWPGELFPPNTEFGLPFWNHILFFLVSWLVQALAPRALLRA